MGCAVGCVGGEGIKASRTEIAEMSVFVDGVGHGERCDAEGEYSDAGAV